MKAKTILTITIICLAFIFSNAQDKQRIGHYNIGVGLSTHSILDDGYAAFTFNSVNPNLTFSFQRDKNKNRIAYGLDAVVGKTNYKKYELFKTDLYDIDLFALYAREINLKNDKMKLHLGGIIDYRILFLLNMNDEFAVGNVSYTVALSLGAYANFDYQYNEENKFSLTFKHPLLSNVVRNPYTGYNNETVLLTNYGNDLLPLIFHNPELTHGFKFFRPSLELAWEKQLSSGKILVPKISTEYLSYNSINPVKYFRTNLSIGLKF